MLIEFQQANRNIRIFGASIASILIHPDSGGESGQFVEITAAYEMLLKMK